MILPILGRLGRDRRGNVAMMFALAIIPLVLIIGMAIDLGNAMRVRLALQDATDSAVLAVARDGLRLTDAEIPTHAVDYLNASYKYATVPYTITKLTFDRATVTAELNVSAKSPTTFMAIFGFNNIPVSTHAISKGLGFEIALVLDTSGSMSEVAGTTTKIVALKAATKSLFDTLFAKASVTDRFTISIVPFAASVNAGSGNSGASWLDSAGASPIHFEDFVNSSKTRAALFTTLKTPWKGCVMTRAAPYDVTDDVPSNGATKFVPWFAPDEPDGDNYKDKGSGKYNYREGTYSNNYIDDEGGGCTGTDTTVKATDAVKQGRVCKYTGATPAAGKGPNYLCDSTAITPLTNSRSTLDTAVNNLSPAGNTNIFEGLMWGWRSLSSTEPFTQGKAYGAPNNRKVIILMTDGQNNYSGASNYNLSQYFSYGFARFGR
ncbi:MAG: pilus assembly protein TadG-related protein, partial [Caulobacteraceae bacterium]